MRCEVGCAKFEYVPNEGSATVGIVAKWKSWSIHTYLFRRKHPDHAQLWLKKILSSKQIYLITVLQYCFHKQSS